MGGSLSGPSTGRPPDSRRLLLRPRSPSTAFEAHGGPTHAPGLRIPAAAEVPALVLRLCQLVHVDRECWPPDHSGVCALPARHSFQSRQAPHGSLSPTDFPRRKQKLGVSGTGIQPVTPEWCCLSSASSPSRLTGKPSRTCFGWASHG